MTNSRTFEKDRFVKDATEAGLALPIAEAIADEYVYLDALVRGETANSRKFDKDRCVKRLTDAGIALPIAKVFADQLVRTDTFLRGESPDRTHESERKTS